MKQLLQVSVVLFVILLLKRTAASHSELQQQFDNLWNQFKKTFNKVYSDQVEDSYRRQVWTANMEHITVHNIQADLGQHSFTLGLNEYSDLTMDEYRKQLLGLRVPYNYLHNSTDFQHNAKYDISYLPDSVDWRDQGYVTPVKNQGSCGSCWAFSSTGALEGQNFKKTGQLISLSEQNLVDCSGSFGNEGCNGGWVDYAFRYVASNGGIDTEDSYPYEAVDDDCRFKSASIGCTCSGFKDLSPRGDESALMAAVATIGPIAVAIDANHPNFFQYKGGVFNEADCTTTVDHAVLLVGYGTYQGQEYWLVKNSWGESWGDEGYIMMSRNKGNQCGIASYASYPIV